MPDRSAGAPASVAHQGTNLLGLASLLGGIAWVLAHPEWPAERVVVLLLALTAGPILLLDVLVHRVHRRASTGLDWAGPHRRDLGRIATKGLGAAAAVGMVLGVYNLAPEYVETGGYDRFFRFLRTFLGPAIGFGVVYVWFLDRYLVEPQDGYWHLGRFLLGRPFDPSQVGQTLRGWVVKGFFTPLMFTYATQSIEAVRYSVQAEGEPLLVITEMLFNLSFLVDVLFACGGYLLSLRLFDTHLRSTEPTMLGWAAALACYEPFWGVISTRYVSYAHGYTWSAWLEPFPTVRAAWGVVLVALVAIYAGATVCFGVRFSNLTHRGVLTNGLYRWVRHPAYWSKNLYWWLFYIPFVYRGSWVRVVRDCFWLLVLNAIYWVRARTEEAHLSRDPDYVAYARFVDRRGWFRMLPRLFPFLAFRPTPEASEEERDP